ncbi:hypothetical protein [Streptomyces sp. NPDC091371]|uniref:hypothetical protein n=1 Tax=Streptomyces sp. NPDC091371 TaxID=3155303 RepID=UPI00343ADE8C
MVGYGAARDVFNSPLLSRDWQRWWRQAGRRPPYALNMLDNSGMLLTEPPRHT